MNVNADREVEFGGRDLSRVLALGNKLTVLFYVGVGISLSHALFGFPHFYIEINHLIGAFAAFIVVSTGWVIYRSVLRQRRATTSHKDNNGNRGQSIHR